MNTGGGTSGRGQGTRSPHQEARRRWGRARVVTGGLGRPSRKGRKSRPRLPGTAAERRVIERVVGRKLGSADMQDAVKLLRAGAHLKEIEINERIESILQPRDD